jgi:hypothetical protein
MAFDFERLKAKAKELTNTGVTKAKELTATGVNKAKELSEIGKLKVQNISEQDEIRKAYMAMGKLYYEKYGMDPGPDFEEHCKKISDSMAKIEYNNERIADMKAAGNLSDEEVEEAEIDENAPEL